MKLGKNAKNMLKIKEKAEILTQIFKKEEISWKEELSQPWVVSKGHEYSFLSNLHNIKGKDPGCVWYCATCITSVYFCTTMRGAAHNSACGRTLSEESATFTFVCFSDFYNQISLLLATLQLRRMITTCRFMVAALSSNAALAIIEWHCFQVELNSTVCNLPRWAKQQGHWFIAKMLLAAWTGHPSAARSKSDIWPYILPSCWLFYKCIEFWSLFSSTVSNKKQLKSFEL